MLNREIVNIAVDDVDDDPEFDATRESLPNFDGLTKGVALEPSPREGLTTAEAEYGFELGMAVDVLCVDCVDAADTDPTTDALFDIRLVALSPGEFEKRIVRLTQLVTDRDIEGSNDVVENSLEDAVVTIDGVVSTLAVFKPLAVGCCCDGETDGDDDTERDD